MGNVKKILKRVTKKQIVVMVSILLVAVLIVFLVNKFNTDGMMQTKGVKVYYRTYTKEHGWSMWTKNGKTSGNKKDNILNIEIKVKSRTPGNIVYSVYNSNGKWQRDNIPGTKIKNNEIQGLKVSLISTLSRKYDVLYRFYIDGKWTNWYSNGYNSEIKKSIKAIDIKILPKNANLNNYLRDYNYVQKKKGEK